MDRFTKQASKIAQAMYNAAKNPDQFQNPPHTSSNQQNGHQQNGHQPQSPYQQSGQQSYGQQSSYHNPSHANEPIYGQIAPPAAYGSSAYHGPVSPQSQIPPYGQQHAGVFTSPTPVNSAPPAFDGPVAQYSSSVAAQSWGGPDPPPQTPISPQTYSTTPGTPSLHQSHASMPYAPPISSIPPPPHHHTTAGPSNAYTSTYFSSPYPGASYPGTGQEPGVHTSYSAAPPQLPGQDSGIGLGHPPTAPPAYMQSFPSPMGNPATPHQQPLLNHPNTYPPYNPSTYGQGAASSPLNMGIGAPSPRPTSSHPASSHATPTQEPNSYIAELPADGPIELPAELPASLGTTNRPSEHAPPINHASHPNAPSQAYATHTPAVSPGPTSPQPLLASSANIPAERLEQPKPVHPDQTAAATAQQIADMTPLSPPLPHSAPPIHQQLPPPPPMSSYPQTYATMPPPPPAPYGAAHQPSGPPPGPALQPTLSYNSFANKISQSQPQAYSQGHQPVHQSHPPGPPPPSAYSNPHQMPHPPASEPPFAPQNMPPPQYH